jgi:hypothetical protein
MNFPKEQSFSPENKEDFSSQKTWQIMDAIGVKPEIFKNQELATDMLAKCLYDPGSLYPTKPLPEKTIAILKEKLVEEGIYNNKLLPAMPILSSAILPILLEKGNLIPISMIDQDSVFNSNQVHILDANISREDGRQNGNRTIKFGQEMLVNNFPDYQFVRWGGDEYVVLVNSEEAKDSELTGNINQMLLLLQGESSFFENKGGLSLKPVSFKMADTGSSLLERIKERPRVKARYPQKNLETLKLRMKDLTVMHRELESFFAQIELSGQTIPEVDTLLEILENTYYDPLLSQENVEPASTKQEVRCYCSAEEFANRLAVKNEKQTLLCIRVPNVLRLLNKDSYKKGDAAIVRIYKEIIASELPEIELLRRGSDFYLAVNSSQSESFVSKTKPKLDQLAQKLLLGTKLENDLAIPFALVQEQPLEFNRKDKPIVNLGKAMDSLAITEYDELTKEFNKLAKSSSLKSNKKFQEFLFDYFFLKDKRGRIRIEEILRQQNKLSKDELDELIDLNSAVILGNNGEAKNKLLIKIIAALQKN